MRKHAPMTPSTDFLPMLSDATEASLDALTGSAETHLSTALW